MTTKLGGGRGGPRDNVCGVPRLFHPYHVRVYVNGPQALLATVGVWVFWLLVLGLAAKACHGFGVGAH